MSSFEELTISTLCLHTLKAEGKQSAKQLYLECQAHLDPTPTPAEVLAELNRLVTEGALEVLSEGPAPYDTTYGVKQP